MNLRFGIIGAGGMGRVHGRNLAKMEDVEIGWVADVNPEAGEGLAKELGCAFVRNWKRGLDDVDCVVICTPPFAHYKQVVECAQAGKHIFIEKPLCLTMREADAIKDVVDATGVNFMIGYVLRFFPAFRAFKLIKDEGRIGDLVVVWINRMGSLPHTPWLWDAKKSGGMTVEFNTHDIDFLCWIGGAPSQVYGKTLNARKDIGIEDNVWGILTFEDGIGVLGSSWSNPLGFFAVGMIGTKGVALMKPEGVVQLKTESEEETFTPPQDVDPYYDELREFVECVKEGRRAEIGVDVAHLAMEVALAVQRSSRMGRAITLAR